MDYVGFIVATQEGVSHFETIFDVFPHKRLRQTRERWPIVTNAFFSISCIFTGCAWISNGTVVWMPAPTLPLCSQVSLLFSRWPFCSPTTFPVPKMPTVTTESGRCQGNPRRMTSVKPAYQREENIYPACLNPWHRATAAPQSAFRPDRLTRPPTLLPGYTLYDTRKIFSIFDHRFIQRNMLKRGMLKKCERNIPGSLLVRFNHNDHQINWRFSLSL